MPMTPLERKAAFKHQTTLDQTTLESAARSQCGVTWLHLSEGIADRRPLSLEVQQKFAAYIGRSVEDVFGDDPRRTDDSHLGAAVKGSADYLGRDESDDSAA